jgi:threonine dehydrogenase-like Zn-dependent dehydrogenase
VRALVCDLSVPRQVVSGLLGRIDKRFYLGPFSPASLREVPDPVLPADDWVVIRTRLCGICGSDYKQMFLNGSMDNPMTALISFPQVLGHEVVGTIERVGPGVRTRTVGERVVLNPWLSCGPRGITPPCAACADGQYSICRNFAHGVIPPGIHTGNSSAATGGFAPFVPAHESMCIPIPDGVRDEEAVLADPFSVSLHAVLKRPPAPGAPVLVYGCGTLGLLSIPILRLLHPDSRILAVARFAHQRALAERLGAHVVLAHEPVDALVRQIGAETHAEVLTPWYGMPWLYGGGVDVVYDSVGLPETVEVGIRVVASRGAVVVTGVEMPRRFEWTPLYFKEVSVIGSNAFGVETFEGRRWHAMEIYLELVRRGLIDGTPILTHRFRLDQWREAFLACGDQGSSGAVKVLFTYDDDGPRGGSAQGNGRS